MFGDEGEEGEDVPVAPSFRSTAVTGLARGTAEKKVGNLWCRSVGSPSNLS